MLVLLTAFQIRLANKPVLLPVKCMFNCIVAYTKFNTEFRTDEIVGFRTGARPLTVDGFPLIGSTGIDGLMIATGTYRNGILMAPAIAEIIASAILGTEASIANPFEPTRRASLCINPSPQHLLNNGVRDLVSFIQEPHGNLPYERAQELESFLTVLLTACLTDNLEAQRGSAGSTPLSNE